MEYYFFFTRELPLRDEEDPREAVLFPEELEERLLVAEALRLPDELERGADRTDEELGELALDLDWEAEERLEDAGGLVRTLCVRLGARTEDELE